jgi:uncharacterized membrane protein (DUF485 family)
MQSTPDNRAVQTADIAGVVLSAFSLTFVALYPALWWFARELMRWRIFGSAVTFGTAFAILVLFAPLLLALRFVRRNNLSERERIYETSNH